MKFLLVQYPTLEDEPLHYRIIWDRILGYTLFFNNTLYQKIINIIGKNKDIYLRYSDITIATKIKDIVNIEEDMFRCEKNEDSIEDFLHMEHIIKENYILPTRDNYIYMYTDIYVDDILKDFNYFDYFKHALINSIEDNKNEIFETLNKHLVNIAKIEEIKIEKR